MVEALEPAFEFNAVVLPACCWPEPEAWLADVVDEDDDELCRSLLELEELE